MLFPFPEPMVKNLVTSINGNVTIDNYQYVWNNGHLNIYSGGYLLTQYGYKITNNGKLFHITLIPKGASIIFPYDYDIFIDTMVDVI